MSTRRVDLAAIDRDVEIVVRAGDAHAPDARNNLQEAYKRLDVVNYPDAPGISTLFRVGASVDDLLREGIFPHRKVSWAHIGRIIGELSALTFELVLFVTPAFDVGLPDHHSLAVAQNGLVLSTLPNDAADALMRALTVVDNPYRRLRPSP